PKVAEPVLTAGSPVARATTAEHPEVTRRIDPGTGVGSRAWGVACGADSLCSIDASRAGGTGPADPGPLVRCCVVGPQIREDMGIRVVVAAEQPEMACVIRPC